MRMDRFKQAKAYMHMTNLGFNEQANILMYAYLYYADRKLLR